MDALKAVWLIPAAERLADGHQVGLLDEQFHATLVRASEETRARIAPFPPEPGPLATLSQGLRRKFDPRGVLNPGLMGA